MAVTGKKVYADYEIRAMTIKMHVSACAIKELCSACDAVTAKIHCMYFLGYCSLVTNPASPQTETHSSSSGSLQVCGVGDVNWCGHE